MLWVIISFFPVSGIKDFLTMLRLSNHVAVSSVQNGLDSTVPDNHSCTASEEELSSLAGGLLD